MEREYRDRAEDRKRKERWRYSAEKKEDTEQVTGENVKKAGFFHHFFTTSYDVSQAYVALAP